MHVRGVGDDLDLTADVDWPVSDCMRGVGEYARPIWFRKGSGCGVIKPPYPMHVRGVSDGLDLTADVDVNRDNAI